MLRLDRVVESEIIGEASTIPSDLDPIGEVEEHLAEGWAHTIEVRIEASVDAAAPFLPRNLGRLSAIDEEHCVLRGSTDELAEYAARLAFLPYPFTVIGSDAARVAVREVADRLASAVEPTS